MLAWGRLDPVSVLTKHRQGPPEAVPRQSYRSLSWSLQLRAPREIPHFRGKVAFGQRSKAPETATYER
jgi:hypothetical protein